jgi:ABC-type lipoprotein export system ATPase subunit
MNNGHDLAVRCEHLTHRLHDGRVLFSDLHLSIYQGEKVSLSGPSGSGKTTLLHALAGLSRPQTGSVYFFGKNMHAKGAKAIARLYQCDISFVYQQAYWLWDFSVIENVAMPLLIQGVTYATAMTRAADELSKYGVCESHFHAPCKVLSGGERQRMCLARATVTRPRLLIADEPTGALDRENARVVIDYFNALDGHTTVLVATHDVDIKNAFQRNISL